MTRVATLIFKAVQLTVCGLERTMEALSTCIEWDLPYTELLLRCTHDIVDGLQRCRPLGVAARLRGRYLHLVANGQLLENVVLTNLHSGGAYPCSPWTASIKYEHSIGRIDGRDIILTCHSSSFRITLRRPIPPSLTSCKKSGTVKSILSTLFPPRTTRHRLFWMRWAV